MKHSFTKMPFLFNNISTRKINIYKIRDNKIKESD